MSFVPGVIVSTALTLAPAPAPRLEPFKEIERHLNDLASEQRYDALGSTAGRAFERRDLAPEQRRALAFFAVRGMHGVFEHTGDVAKLCDAQHLLRRVERELGLGDDAVVASRLRAVTEQFLSERGIDDPCPRKPPPRKTRTRAVAAPPPPPSPPEAASSDPATGLKEHVDSDMTSNTDNSVASPEATGTKRHVDPDMSKNAPSTPPPATRPRDASDRLLLAAGGVTLAVGLGLGVTASFLGARMLDLWQESRVLHAVAGPIGSNMDSAHDHALAREYDRLRGPTIATAILGSSALVIGAVLVGVGAKRLTRVSARVAVLPAPGGLQLRARF